MSLTPMAQRFLMHLTYAHITGNRGHQEGRRWIATPAILALHSSDLSRWMRDFSHGIKPLTEELRSLGYFNEDGYFNPDAPWRNESPRGVSADPNFFGDLIFIGQGA